jgi:hypothetical protein
MDGRPRAANEKIVADLAHELEMSVPPVVLYNRGPVVAGEEHRCCLSLIMYPEVYEWGTLFDLSLFPPLVQNIVRSSIAHYSGTVALDLWIGQTDRNNARNVVFGIDSADHSDASFMFVDHSFTLNEGDRWRANGWTTISPVPLPDVFKAALSRQLLLDGADKIAGLPDETIRSIVSRIPEEYMPQPQRDVVCEGLIGRKAMLTEHVVRNF